jgi:UDP-2,3-diacylglucosamine pyrophosphatase LpxH
MSTTVFLSDIHISAGWGLKAEEGKYAWEWFTKSHSDRFVAFLNWLTKRTTPDAIPNFGKVDEVVLVGDVWDNWVFPVDIVPPTMMELLNTDNAQKAIKALDALSQNIPVIWMSGNHDFSLKADQLQSQSVLPKVSFGGRGVDNPFFSNGRLRAEHGNAYGLFCSPDPLRPNFLPLGYFISRISATADRDSGNDTPNLTTILKELAHTLGKDEIAQGVLDAVCSKANLSLNSKIAMPNDFWGGQDTTVGEVRTMYAKLAKEFETRNGFAKTAIAIPAELGNLELAADMLFPRGGINAVIMGHTHTPVAHQFMLPFLGKVAYVNTGCWCPNNAPATWVEADKLTNPTRTELTVYQCTGVDDNGLPQGLTKLFGTVAANGD